MTSGTISLTIQVYVKHLYTHLLQLADHLTRHFKTLQVTEKEVLTYFIYMAKNYKSKLDQKSGPAGEGASAGGNASRS